MDRAAPSPMDLVNAFLRGQNLEQMGRVDEAITLYERAVEGSFDSPGPYDRLIFIYSERALHADVIRVADAALAQVHTHADKRAWFERMRAEAAKAGARLPPAKPKRAQ